MEVEDCVSATGEMEQIRSGPAMEGVVALSASKGVVVVSTAESVVALSALKGVVVATTAESVVVVPAAEEISA